MHSKSQDVTLSVIVRRVTVNDFGSTASNDLIVQIFDDDTGGGWIVQELKVELFGNVTTQPTILRSEFTII